VNLQASLEEQNNLNATAETVVLMAPKPVPPVVQPAPFRPVVVPVTAAQSFGAPVPAGKKPVPGLFESG